MGGAYTGNKRIDPVALTGALAMSGGMVALMIAMGVVEISPIKDDPIDVILIDAPLDPPPIPPEPVKQKIEIQPKAAPPLVREPIVKPIEPGPNVLEDTSVVATDNWPSSFGSGTGDGAGIVVEPPKPAPVFVDAAVDPRYAGQFQPLYPSRERFAENEGRVTVRVLIGPDGRVKAVERKFATSDAFFEATRDRALKYWRFRPATRDGVAVEAWREMTVRFELES